MLQQKIQNTQTISGLRTTPFGATENPTILRNVDTSHVFQVDTLVSLKSMFGDSILMSREHLYKLVSGPDSDELFRSLLTSYYKRYYAFANYVDNQYVFEDQSVPLVVRIIQPVRNQIDECAASAKRLCQIYGGKHLGNDKDYSYFWFDNTDLLPNIEGGRLLC